MMMWVEFLIGAALIILAGTRLSRYADQISVRTGLGGAFVGFILLATVTSLPELAVSATSIVAVGSPDLAVSGLLGSNTFNLAIIVLLDILYRSGPLLQKVYPGHVLSAGLGVMFISTVSALILFYEHGGILEILGVGLSSFIFVGIYIVAVRLIFRYERRMRETEKEEEKSEKGPIAALVVKTIAAAAVIVGVGIWLSLTGEKIAAATGWGESFVGSLFLAAATSLPEAVVSIGALRLGRADMAISNLLGSNLFNMVVIAVCDVLYRPGALLKYVSPAGLMSGLTALVMTGIVITALVYRTKTKSILRIGFEAVALGFVYLMGSYFLFVLSSR
ncbi:MAG: sodium:calcium antiporter [Candidatus Aminicenantes bacterium]|nr:sodium:calcium antiporter [Candidatus Aminicenantes bacterium]